MNQSHPFPWTEPQLSRLMAKAVADYWKGRGGQSKRQGKSGAKDVGTRSEVTGGQHLNGFLTLLCDVIRAAGFSENEILLKSGMELPGYFRPQKKWDVVVVRKERLYAAIELKSQVGSFGNNFNNRSEEAIGNSTDFWTAYREGAMGLHQPWLGYFFLLEKAQKSTQPVQLRNGCFPALSIFTGTRPTHSDMPSFANGFCWSGNIPAHRCYSRHAASPARILNQNQVLGSTNSHGHCTVI